MTRTGQDGVMPVLEDRDPGGRPRRVNQDMVDQMVELRQKGYTSKDIVGQVGVSERTVKRREEICLWGNTVSPTEPNP